MPIQIPLILPVALTTAETLLCVNTHKTLQVGNFLYRQQPFAVVIGISMFTTQLKLLGNLHTLPVLLIFFLQQQHKMIARKLMVFFIFTRCGDTWIRPMSSSGRLSADKMINPCKHSPENHNPRTFCSTYTIYLIENAPSDGLTVIGTILDISCQYCSAFN